MRTRADLLIILGEAEERLTEIECLLQKERDRWASLKDKVEETLENLDRGRKRAEAELVVAADALRVASPPEHEEATAKCMLATDASRRAYSMYDAIRSVKIWMKGFM